MTKPQLITKEIAALMQQFPLKYPLIKYNSTRKRFKIILNELYEQGKLVRITSVYQGGKQKFKPRYHYQVEIDLEVIVTKRTSAGAKSYVFDLYKESKNSKDET